MSKWSKIRVGTVAACMLVPLATAQTQPLPPILYQPDPDSPIGVRNPAAPEQTQQLDFLIGDWDVAVTLHPPERDSISYQARWHNHWVVDGYVVMQEWRGPFATGTELRSFNPATGQWDGRNYYTSRMSWTESAGEFTNGEFIVETRDTGPNGPVINRERYYDIQPASFRMSATRSEDGGATWSSATYELFCTRIE